MSEAEREKLIPPVRKVRAAPERPSTTLPPRAPELGAVGE